MSTLATINPVEPFLRMDRMPHIWCPGCGIGTTVNCFTRALVESKLPLDKVAIVSGIGCTGRVAGYMNFDSFHTTHGRAIPFATGLKLANPDLNVVVYSGDGDLIAIGGNHFIHAARRNADIKVICVNNFTYGMTGGQVTATTPLGAKATTVPYGAFEQPFNLPYLAESSGAVYVARWTTFHVRHIARSIVEAFNKKGFAFIEILSPCPTLYQRRNKLGDGLDTMRFYKQHSVIKNGASTRDVDIGFQSDIIVGKFVDIERPPLQQAMEQQLRQTLQERYAGRGGNLMAATGIRIAGFGGQGVILAGMVIGKAAALHDGKFVTLTQSFGPEARGSACSVQLLVSNEPILYPYLTQPDILVVMSQEANTLYAPGLKPDGTLLYEQDLIEVGNTTPGMRHCGIPATRFAEELGRKLVLNMVMVGFVTAVTGLATPQAVRKAIADSVPKGTENLNLAAFEKGLAFVQSKPA